MQYFQWALPCIGTHNRTKESWQLVEAGAVTPRHPVEVLIPDPAIIRHSILRL